jgi:hypothetical protein
MIQGRALVSAAVNRISPAQLQLYTQFQIALTVTSSTPFVLPSMFFSDIAEQLTLEIILVLRGGSPVMWKTFITAKLAGLSTTWCF